VKQARSLSRLPLPTVLEPFYQRPIDIKIDGHILITSTKS